MRMERINGHEVRCVITSQDLADRKISVRELKYGSRATAELFREMVAKASDQYGFNEDELPVMIEAVPMNPEELLVIISAVENAEELDPHYAHFSDSEGETQQEQGTQAPEPFYDPEAAAEALKTCVIRFTDLDAVMDFCHRVGSAYPGRSFLYRREEAEGYYLVILRPEDMDVKDFNVFLNSILEFGDPVRGSSFLYASLKEHSEPVMEDPLKKLGAI